MVNFISTYRVLSMAKTKTEKITSIEEEIRQLENKRRQLVQEQKAQESREDEDTDGDAAQG